MEQAEFLGYKNFIKNRHEIKKQYFLMPFKQKQIYKWYVYANPLISEDNKDLIWEYLNNDISNTKLKNAKVRV